MSIKNPKQARRAKIHQRAKKKLQGTATCPRVVIFKSNKYVYAQLVDDTQGATLLAVDTKKLGGKTIPAAKKAAELLATQAKERNINKLLFDRSGYLYHGIVKEFSQTLNQQGF